jgi:hypothetical protein
VSDLSSYWLIILHSILTTAIEQYVKSLQEDVQNITEVVSENGKRLMEVDDSLRQAKRWQIQTGVSLAKLDERVVASDEADQLRHADIKRTILHTSFTQKEEQTRNEILVWLAHTDPNTNHNDACEKRDDDTGLWFLNGDIYKQWQQIPQSFLWLHGPAGCGKTILS